MPQIKTLIFDFGDVFINLDKQGIIERGKMVFGKNIISEAKSEEALDIYNTNNAYEKGLISNEEFTSFYTNLSTNVSTKAFVELWNSPIKDFPKYRLDWLQYLANKKKFKLILLSNTNDLHIEYIKKVTPFYKDFKNCFDAFYLSHQIHLRKPDAEIFEFVLNENNLKANECLFVDDTKQNTDAASQLGIHTWTIDETSEDVTQLFNIKNELF